MDLPAYPLILLTLAAPNLFAAEFPGKDWSTATPAELDLDAAKLEQARDYALTAEGSGNIIYKGKLVMSWGDPGQRYDLKSTSKSIGGTLLGIALKDGKVQLDDPARKYHPTFGVPPATNSQTGWLDKITLRMLANQTAGFEKPGGYQPLLFAPGTKWHYSDSGPNWLAECVTLIYERDLNDIIFERVFTPIGITPADIVWRRNAFRPPRINNWMRREFGSGFSANVNAMARIGYLYLREGRWQGREILPLSFIHAIREPDPTLAKSRSHDPTTHGNAAAHYSMLWWNNADGTIAGFPRDAHWSWGLYDSLIVVVPSLDLVVARAGPAKSWKRDKDADHYEVLKPFLQPIAAAVPVSIQKRSAAIPPSPVIKEIAWDAANSIIRKAKGSDNWPITWADDDHLYTAYGDGNGFEPFRKEKLSIGLVRIEGTPPNLTGINIPSPTLDAKGDGARGRKAGGLLCVKDVFYLWARNVANSQLASSSDHGQTWTWTDWKFTNSFGCPTFLNFGRNYAGARDHFVYIYSHDSDGAYERADRFVLARVPQDRIRDRTAYEFFVRLDANARPLWSTDIASCGAVLTNPGMCYRSSISYHPGLKRYLWCQTGAGEDTRFAGGFAICDAPDPWGPWTVAFQTKQWDVGPGESMHLPTKWMKADELWLLFSGDDCFSLRRGRIINDEASQTSKRSTQSN
jgi:CubicO group peptidase (beta-lactamase class C family)